MKCRGVAFWWLLLLLFLKLGSGSTTNSSSSSTSTSATTTTTMIHQRAPLQVVYVLGTCDLGAHVTVWNVQKSLPGVLIQIFFSRESDAFVHKVFGDRAGIVLTPLPDDFFDRVGQDQYRSFVPMFTYSSFWDLVVYGETVLMTQSDAYICDDSADRLARWMPYAFVGAPWLPWIKFKPKGGDESDKMKWTYYDRNKTANEYEHHPSRNRRYTSAGLNATIVEQCNGVGNGGFSLRHVDTMKAIARDHGPSLVLPEDLFFCVNIGINKAGLVPVEAAGDFSWEETNVLGEGGPMEAPFGVHRPWRSVKSRTMLYSTLDNNQSNFARRCRGLNLVEEAFREATRLRSAGHLSSDEMCQRAESTGRRYLERAEAGEGLLPYMRHSDWMCAHRNADGGVNETALQEANAMRKGITQMREARQAMARRGKKNLPGIPDNVC